jgi:hypothetical protein
MSVLQRSPSALLGPAASMRSARVRVVDYTRGPFRAWEVMTFARESTGHDKKKVVWISNRSSQTD